MLPLHVWLPEAHPAAPSPVSALMSGVMLKTAIYGLLRVPFDLLHTPAVVVGRGRCWCSGSRPRCSAWSSPPCRRDMKRLLAYSSIENIGIILVGIGLAILFQSYGMRALAALALTAALYHCAEPRLLQEPAVPRHRLGAARHAASAAWASWAA